jgi:hypothetical protein
LLTVAHVVVRLDEDVGALVGDVVHDRRQTGEVGRVEATGNTSCRGGHALKRAENKAENVRGHAGTLNGRETDKGTRNVFIP